MRKLPGRHGPVAPSTARRTRARRNGEVEVVTPPQPDGEDVDAVAQPGEADGGAGDQEPRRHHPRPRSGATRARAAISRTARTTRATPIAVQTARWVRLAARRIGTMRRPPSSKNHCPEPRSALSVRGLVEDVRSDAPCGDADDRRDLPHPSDRDLLPPRDSLTGDPQLLRQSRCATGKAPDLGDRQGMTRLHERNVKRRFTLCQRIPVIIGRRCD